MSTSTERRSRPTPSRVGNLWVVSILFAVVLLLLLIFILQNSQKVKISFFGADGHVPMGAALLLAAVFGILLVALPGSVRIMQLRVRHRRQRKLAQAPQASAPQASAPQASAPQASAPQASAPQTSAPQASAPPTSAPPAIVPAPPPAAPSTEMHRPR
jgi:uncharacterized integral membrane protein